MTSSLRNWVMECYIEPITALTARLETSPRFFIGRLLLVTGHVS